MSSLIWWNLKKRVLESKKSQNTLPHQTRLRSPLNLKQLFSRYFRSNLKSARKEYSVDGLEENSILKKTDRMLEEYDKLRTSTDVGFIQNKVGEDIKKVESGTRHYHAITIEHLSTKVLARGSGNVELWRDLIPCMPGDALVRHTGFLTSMGVYQKSEEIINETVTGFKTRLSKFTQPQTATTQRPVHPFKLLIAELQYQKGRASWQGPTWEPVSDVTNVLHEAFEQSLGLSRQVITNTICVAIDISSFMKESGINGKDWAIKCIPAAQAAAFTLAKMGSNAHLLAFSANQNVALEIGSDFQDFLGKMDDVMNEIDRNEERQNGDATDCTKPLIWAQKQERKDIEAFVVFTVNKNVGSRIQTVEAIQKYRDFSGNQDAKFICCTMNASRFSSSDPADRHMFDICGCDANLPLLVQEFLRQNGNYRTPMNIFHNNRLFAWLTCIIATHYMRM